MPQDTTQSKTINAGPVKLHYLEAGEGDPMIFVHGWPTSAYLWRDQFGALSHYVRTIAPDLPGFGQSDKPQDIPLTASYYSNILFEFMDALGIEKATFVAHDIGAVATLLLAIRTPERVQKLVILNTLPYPDLPVVPRVLFGAMLPIMRQPTLSRLVINPATISLMFTTGTVNRFHREHLRAYYQPYKKDAEARESLRRALGDSDFKDMREVAAGLKTIQQPTLILWGKNDYSAPLSVGRRLNQDIKGSRLVVIPRCGHFVPEDQAGLVNAQLLKFLGAEESG
jgi:pimeloyl-ACP methyl ester carboxylesterase